MSNLPRGDEGRVGETVVCATPGCNEVFVKTRPNRIAHHSDCKSRRRYPNLVQTKDLLYAAVDELQAECRRVLTELDGAGERRPPAPGEVEHWRTMLREVLDRTDRILSEVPLDPEDG